MDTPSASTRDLARRLLAREAGNADRATHPHGQEALRVCEKLRVSLSRFAGPDGFTSLLRRALTLAKVEVPALQSVTVSANGSLEGFAQTAGDVGKADDASGGEGGDEHGAEGEEVPGHLRAPGAGVLMDEAAVAITAHLLGLLVTFIGERLTLRLVGENWPDEASLKNPPNIQARGNTQ